MPQNTKAKPSTPQKTSSTYKTIDAFLKKNPDFERMKEGTKILCKSTGYEIVPDLAVLEKYLNGRSYKKAQWYSFDFSPYEKFYLVQSRHNQNKLFSHLDKNEYNKIPQEIESLIKSPRYQKALKKKEEELKEEEDRKARQAAKEERRKKWIEDHPNEQPPEEDEEEGDDEEGDDEEGEDEPIEGQDSNGMDDEDQPEEFEAEEEDGAENEEGDEGEQLYEVEEVDDTPIIRKAPKKASKMEKPASRKRKETPAKPSTAPSHPKKKASKS
eukprot:TRINITY_DN5517_c0_g1_i1.p1 TRINITY_DN5517_c0_g1~~TRINITY_DN5517_c0_g1_i1.p1  ORF type:complete len:270 (-),score=97.70 TRINITY_DN5517_c0_g1_i1:87-896(-)